MIATDELERATMILSDQAGIAIAPVMQPGSEAGTGDLVVDLNQRQTITGLVGVDNYGNRYTGTNKAKANLNINSPFMLGDQITLSSLYSQEGMWFGNLGYNLPMNGSGLRGNMGYAHTYYQLGGEFKNTKKSGIADIYSAGISYPLVRSQSLNLNLSLSVQHKALTDSEAVNDTSTSKTSNSLPIGMSFDTKDRLLGGGLTFGSVTLVKTKFIVAIGLRQEVLVFYSNYSKKNVTFYQNSVILR